MSATLASPDFCTSKPVPAPPDLATGSSNWARYLASLAFKRPRWYSVAYLGVVWAQKFCILDGSSLPYFSVLMRVEQDRSNVLNDSLLTARHLLWNDDLLEIPSMSGETFCMRLTLYLFDLARQR